MKFIVILILFLFFSVKADNCDGEPLGTSRISPTQTCPFGYVGRYVDVCVMTSGSKRWRPARGYCEPISCGGNSSVGTIRQFTCPANHSGSMTMTCQATGMWSVTANNCIPNSEKCLNAFAYRALACPRNYYQGILQVCLGSNWNTLAGSCLPLTCSSTNIGDITANTSSTCGSGYVGFYNQTCTYPNDWSGSYYSNAKTINYWSRCRPSYSSCAPTNSKRSQSCPPFLDSNAGRSQVYRQTCTSRGNIVSDYSEGAFNCRYNKCGDYNVGHVVVAPDVKCPDGRPIGQVMSVCTETGWLYSSSTCTAVPN